MTSRKDILAKEFPYNLIDELRIRNRAMDVENYPSDIVASFYYVFHLLLNEEEREIILYRWKDKLSLREVSEVSGRKRNKIESIESMAVRKMSYSQYGIKIIKYGVNKVIKEAK